MRGHRGRGGREESALDPFLLQRTDEQPARPEWGRGPPWLVSASCLSCRRTSSVAGNAHEVFRNDGVTGSNGSGKNEFFVSPFLEFFDKFEIVSKTKRIY